MKKSILFIPMLIMVFAPGVQAHGPVRQKADEKITINAPAAKVWELVKNFGDMSWHLKVKSSVADNGNNNDSIRTLTLQNGGTLTEELTAYDADKMKYKYKITQISTAQTINHAGNQENVPVFPVNNFSADIQVEANENDASSSVVTWKAGYYRAYLNNDPPPEMNEHVANTAVKEFLESGLAHLKELAQQ